MQIKLIFFRFENLFSFSLICFCFIDFKFKIKLVDLKYKATFGTNIQLQFENIQVLKFEFYKFGPRISG